MVITNLSGILSVLQMSSNLLDVTVYCILWVLKGKQVLHSDLKVNCCVCKY